MSIFEKLLLWLATLVGAFKAGEGKVEKKILEERAENAEKEAQKWADARNVSTPSRLRNRAKRKRDS